MNRKFWALALSLILAMPFVLRAEEEEVEIQLVEVVGMSMLPGEDPLGNPTQEDTNPPRPTDFRATITGRMLAVTSDNANNTQVVVRNASGTMVVNAQFVAFTAEQLPSSGTHTIEIHNGGLTLVGTFQAH